MRLQVFLSRSGVCSRRQAMVVIFDGRVKVNGAVCREPGTDVAPDRDQIEFDGERIMSGDPVYIILHKPAGYVTTKSDPHAARTVMDLLPENLRYLHPVGRLDQNTTGLLMLTNDGELTQRLIHPSFHVDKVYHVTLDRRLAEPDRQKLQKGVLLEEGLTAPCQISLLNNAEAEITLHEGRKRQVRRMFACLHYHVAGLCRVKFGPLLLGPLDCGSWRHLTLEEIRALKEMPAGAARRKRMPS